MEESAEERRQRLKRLREDAQGHGHQNDGEVAEPDNNASKFSDLSFRNYKPRNEVIGARKKEASKPRELDAPASSTLTDVIKDDQTAIQAFAPKKPHMDLKRDVAKSLRKLERATAQAIDELRVELELKDAADDQE